jgi:hypothetical protein
MPSYWEVFRKPDIGNLREKPRFLVLLFTEFGGSQMEAP